MAKPFYVKIPRALLDSHLIDKHDLLVYLGIAVHADRDGHARPGISKIAKNSRLSKSSVKRALVSLRELGFIKISKRYSENGFNSNKYVLPYHPTGEIASTSGLYQQKVSTDEVAEMIQSEESEW